MDINTLISSKIKKSGNLYEIQLPNFFGRVEGVYYAHNGQLIDYCMNRFGEKLDLSELSKELEAVLLLSEVFGNLWIRMVHSNNPLQDTLIIAQAAKIVSFSLRGKTYYGILSYDIDGELSLITNFSSNDIFSHFFENGVWSISNRLTGIVLYTFSFPYSIGEITPSGDIGGIGEETYELFLVNDFLFPEKKEKQRIESFFLKNSSSIQSNILIGVYVDILHEDIVRLRLQMNGSINESQRNFELSKLVGIIGNHLIFTGGSMSIPGFLSIKDINTAGVTLGENFTLSDSISLIDPHWHEMRVALMELRYLVYSIENHILLTKDSLQAIDSLDNNHLEAQELRIEMTLENLEKMRQQYNTILHTLITTIRQNTLS